MKLYFDDTAAVKVRLSFEDSINCQHLQKVEDNKLFDSKFKSIFKAVNIDGQGHVFFGLGKSSEITGYKLIEAFHFLAKELKASNLLDVKVKFPEIGFENTTNILKALEGFLQEEYTWEIYKSDKSDKKELSVHIAKEFEVLEEDFHELENLILGQNITRNLVNTPSNDLYPESYANYIKELFANTAVEVEVFDEKECKEMGMEALLQVGMGSDKKPRFIVMKYLPLADEKEHLTFVGKGLTYDSGGYAVKPATGMVTMKSDMGGSASVVGLLFALQANKVQKNVVGVIAAAENMISGSAYKNGDIISSMKGSTIEVINTDAEGRITLADSLYYAATKLNSKAIIDLATLTGACIVALGEKVTGLVTNNDNLANSLLDSSKAADEYLHKFDVFPCHREQIKSQVADLRNSTVGGAGSITAGLFLEHFVEGKPWVHMDIAGPAWADAAFDFTPLGGTGNPVKTIYDFAKKF